MQAAQEMPADTQGEIDLAQFWRILVRRKKWIFLSFFVCIAAAAAYLVLKAPVYEASAKLRIGQVAGGGPFETPDVLSSRLTAQYGEHVADGIKRDRPFLKRATALRATSGVVELVAEGDAPEDAVSMLERVFADVMKTHGVTYGRNLEFLTERLQQIDAQRTALKQQYEDISLLVDQLKQGNPVQASLIALERGRVAAAITVLDAEKPSIAQKLTPPQTEPTRLLGEVVAPIEPASPKKLLVLVVAAGLGLIAGLVLALIVESVAKAPASGR